MAMVQRGEKPPNVRVNLLLLVSVLGFTWVFFSADHLCFSFQEINDLPPNPNQPLPNPHLAPRAKVCFRMFHTQCTIISCSHIGAYHSAWDVL